MSVKGVSSKMSQYERTSLLGHGGATLWFTGLPAAGKTTLTVELERELVSRGRPAYRLDGDTVRRDLCGDLGFDREARAENVRRVALVSRLLADAGVLALVALISPYTADRELARGVHGALSLPFLEIFVDTPIELCQQRDPKGLYERARRGELEALTGVDDPYERPSNPDLRLSPQPLERSVQSVLELLSSQRLV
jgi:bifunctional enzyme CysN/CysC